MMTFDLDWETRMWNIIANRSDTGVNARSDTVLILDLWPLTFMGILWSVFSFRSVDGPSWAKKRPKRLKKWEEKGSHSDGRALRWKKSRPEDLFKFDSIKVHLVCNTFDPFRWLKAILMTSMPSNRNEC